MDSLKNGELQRVKGTFSREIMVLKRTEANFSGQRMVMQTENGLRLGQAAHYEGFHWQAYNLRFQNPWRCEM